MDFARRRIGETDQRVIEKGLLHARGDKGIDAFMDYYEPASPPCARGQGMWEFSQKNPGRVSSMRAGTRVGSLTAMRAPRCLLHARGDKG